MKKIFSALIALVFALSVAACGGDNKQNPSSSSAPQQSQQQTQQQAEPKKEAPKDDPNATADQKNAVKRARSYVSSVNMAKAKIANQLNFPSINFGTIP